jgi:hypothetical protein
LHTIVLLAAIAALRVPLHDLGIVSEGSVTASLLVFVPPAIWLAVVVQRRVPNPFLTLKAIGVVYGVMLAVIHQRLGWRRTTAARRVSVAHLEGVLAPGVEAVVFRLSAFFSSLVTGTLVGAVAGAVAWAIKRLRQT